MIHHRGAALVVALSALALSACASGSATRPDAGRQVVLDRLAAADDGPYSARLDAITKSGTRRLQHMVGRINLNAPLTGRTTDETEQYTEDVVMTPQKVYRQATGSHSGWQEFPASTAKGGVPVDRLPQYARFILRHGGSVHGGSDAMRVSARLTPKEIESVDRVSGRNLRPATGIDVKVWIDRKGRIVRVNEEVHFKSDADIQITLILNDFKSPVSVKAPIPG
ncbi:hypothetical protein [Streptomyces sp. NPDC048508]|uniref:hypothetical protein n=1 Tax=Streptomyces sp. NPDC048508 TaxID=3365561 RepID=UPI00371A779A